MDAGQKLVTAVSCRNRPPTPIPLWEGPLISKTAPSEIQRATEQAERQARAAIAHNWKLEWHFAEKLASEYYAVVFAGLPNAKMIKVLFDPPLKKP